MTKERINHGIDPGDRSLGIAAIQVDGEDIPKAIAALSLVLHDGGVADEKTTTSRLAVRGTKTRERRRLRRGKSRRKELHERLSKQEFPLERDEQLSDQLNRYFGRRAGHACFPYFVRASLLEPIESKKLARHLFAVAAKHIDRHRGWRNPWVRYATLLESVRAGGMTEQGRMWNEAVGRALDTETPRTLGECAVFAIEQGSGIRPTDYARRLAMGAEKADLDKTVARINRAKTAEDLIPLARHFALPVRPFQHDLLYELLLFAKAQGFTQEEVEPVLKEVFFQERPGFQSTSVGDCPLERDPQLKRAPEFLPSVQEFIVRSYVANLRAVRNSLDHRFSAPEADALSRYLLDETDRENLSFKALEQVLLRKTGELVRIKRSTDAERAADEEPTYGGRPPIDRTNAQAKKAKPNLRKWWRAADLDERELLVCALDSVTRTPEAENFVQSLVTEGVFEADEVEQFADTLSGGRSAYSKRAIERMLPLLRNGMDLFSARQEVYDLPSDWQPPGARWDKDKQRMNHPVLQITRGQIRPILNSLDREVGVPSSIHIEVSRQTLRLKQPDSGGDKRHRERESRNRNAREAAAEHDLYGNGARRKFRIIRDQNNQCAYQLVCDGGALDPLKAEIDHIVPVKEGANNSRANLVATCDACNQVKGGRPFALVASKHQLEEAIGRVKSWNFGVFDRRLEREMIRRLKTKQPDELDERMPTTTAQTATELRGMIEDRYKQRGIEIDAESVMARLVGEARYSAGFNELLEGSRSEGHQKSRLDQRNHLLDAVVVACINNRVIPVLERRAKLREFARLNKSSKREKSLKAKANDCGSNSDYFTKWLDGLKALAEQLKPLLERDQRPGEFSTTKNDHVSPLDLDTVAPRRPLRLKAYSGALHKETACPMLYKAIGDEWNERELGSIADEQISATMLQAADYGNKLAADSNRSIEAHGKTYRADDRVGLLTGKNRQNRTQPKPAAVAVRGASFEAGSVHHVRIYRLPDGKDLAFVPVYSFDVAQAILDARKSDSTGDRRSTYIHLRPECASFRSSGSEGGSKGAKAVRRSVAAGKPLQQLGWIAPGDELWLEDPGVVRAVKIEMPPEWVSETRWYCTGSEKNDLNVRPLLISADLPPDHDGTDRKAPQKCRISWKDLAEHATLIRRDALGRPTYVQRLAGLGA